MRQKAIIWRLYKSY